MRNVWKVTKTAVLEFINDDALTLSAALALYVSLSLAPLLLIAVWILSLVYGDAEQAVGEQAEQAVGGQAGDIIRQVMQRASQQKGQSIAAAILGIGTFLFAASGVFAQLQYSLNRIWNVQARSDAPWWNWFRKRLWTLIMVGAIGAVVLASVVATAVLSALQEQMQAVINWPDLWWAANMIIPMLIYVLLFAMVYKILPDVEIAWRTVWWGAIVTAVLFAIGKHLIGWYIGRGATGSVYGAAGSLIVLLTWLYYSALIFFFGAELTQSISRIRGNRIEPSDYAEWITSPSETDKPAGPG